ncbi:DUF1389 domain-containing protein [Chlamydia caviae]|uniref:DUF1389 domain-containing protein n=1 Tax=Chlamydia caviae (strain ATCC VR-813 / DSM 19441 / 03DC25 / GPIC) TaxID=227941 RepID=Q822P6_CHLCV|nr:DUF1389 domain-containing protein [Chlamydia caviae]AAP05375.1 hypothetical protein CCA_00633 [Chlamydia caviae GPIC]
MLALKMRIDNQKPMDTKAEDRAAASSVSNKFAKSKISYALIILVTLFAIGIIALSVAIPVLGLTLGMGFPLIAAATFGCISALIGLQRIYAHRRNRIVENKKIPNKLRERIFAKYPRAFLSHIHKEDSSIATVCVLDKYNLSFAQLYRLGVLASGADIDPFTDSQELLAAFNSLSQESRENLANLMRNGELDLDSIIEENCPCYWLETFSSKVLQDYNSDVLNSLIIGQMAFLGIFHPQYLPVFSSISMQDYRTLSAAMNQSMYTIWKEDANVKAIVDTALATQSSLSREDREEFLIWLYSGLGICTLNTEAKALLKDLSNHKGQYLNKFSKKQIWNRILDISTDVDDVEFQPSLAYKTWEEWV